MKLHRIELKNLNSLYGEHALDLDQDLGEAPVFLIMGPTGAGKSTLLDAVSLALFGQTPRLERARGRAETESYQIMSHGTGDCTAVVEFSRLSADGVRARYRAEWSCRRARNRPEGNPQTPERSLSRLDDDGAWHLLVSDSRVSVIDPVFNDILEGLSVQDFQRTVLLPQGQFAAFLRADERERADILERLTNTDRFREIGRRAAERMRDARRRCERIEQQAAGLELLPSAERATLERERDEAAAAAEAARARAADARARLRWLDQWASLRDADHAAVTRHDAATQALAARADDLARLDEHERCAEAGAALTARDALRARRDALAAALAASRDAQAALTRGRLEAEASRDAARAALDAAERAFEALRPSLKDARAAHATLAQRAAALTAGRARAADARAALDAGARAHDEAARAAAQVQQTESAQARALHALAHVEALAEALPALVERCLQLGRTHKAIQRQEKERDHAAAERDRVAHEHARLQTESRAAAEALSHAERDDARARAALRDALGAAPDPAARREALRETRAALTARGEALRELARATLALCEAETERDALSRDHAALSRQRDAHARDLDACDRALAVARADLERSRAERADLEVLLRFAAERDALGEGDPCPLCGSDHHPFRHDAREADDLAQQRRALDRRLQTLAAHLDDLERQRRDLDRALSTADATLRERLRATQQLTTRADTLRASLDAARAALPPEDAEDPDAAQRHLTHALDRLAARERALDRAADQQAQAARDLDLARERRARALAQLDTLDATLRDAHARVARLADAVREMADALADDKADLQRDLLDHGVALPPGPKPFNHGLKAARALVEDWKHAVATLDATRRALAEHQQATRDHAVRLERLTADHTAAAAALSDLERAVAAASADVSALFDGRDPDAVEQDHRDASSRARASLEAASSSLAQRLQALDVERATGDERQRQLHAHDQQLDAAQASLRDALARLDLPDEPSLRARLLDDDARRDLAASRARLLEALNRALGQRDAARAALAAHRASPPDDLTDPEALDRVALDAEARDAEALAESAHQRLGALRERLEQQRLLTAQHAALYRDLEAARDHHDLWHDLYKLIGRGNGEEFARFAQILNLEGLIERANLRLSWLAPRYRLASARDDDDMPTLNFAVRDLHLAGTTRPITTLSGGETFLVSLALALALADYSEVEMPIETLLLDEGFGTLDPDTLHIAMDALERLQRRGTQVGLISHVVGLRERVEARVLVEKIGNGRSRLRAELGPVASPLTPHTAPHPLPPRRPAAPRAALPSPFTAGPLFDDDTTTHAPADTPSAADEHLIIDCLRGASAPVPEREILALSGLPPQRWDTLRDQLLARGLIAQLDTGYALSS